jgi:tartrate dehydratase alpha subunit/fumarate hydratase class I-like protein
MPLKPRRETTIERIYREVTGNNMPAAVKLELLPGERHATADGVARGSKRQY